MLKAGVPLNKLDKFRDLLEENALSLTTSSSLRQLLPLILQSETQKLKQEIEGKHVSVLFDGTTHICEALVVVLRFVDSDWEGPTTRMPAYAPIKECDWGGISSPTFNSRIN